MEEYGMRTKVAKILFAMAGCLVLAISSTSIHSQMKETPTSGHNILMVHGRNDPSGGESYGVWNYDQANFWNGARPNTAGTVWYVEWDAWNVSFDSTSGPEVGGEYLFAYAVNQLCSLDNNQSCTIICHSIGCAVVEDWLSKSNYVSSPIYFDQIIAAESAAGGSELADSDAAIFGEALGQNTEAPIDASITTSYARGAYNHNNMQGVAVRGTGGTSNDVATEVITTCHYFPEQSTSTPNANCTTCPLNGQVSCDDGAVALHSTCGHNRVAPFENCNSTLTGYSDTAGTFDYHGWWVDDSGFSGPYSTLGKGEWNSAEKTYRTDHSGGKALVVGEYTSCSDATTLCY
jgi:hypothetical protein